MNTGFITFLQSLDVASLRSVNDRVAPPGEWKYIFFDRHKKQTSITIIISKEVEICKRIKVLLADIRQRSPAYGQ